VKKILSIILSVMMMLSLFSGCTRGMDLFMKDKSDNSYESSNNSTVETTPSLNPDLVKCLGDLIDEDAEAAIHQLMKELQDAYDSYSQGEDLITFGIAVDQTLTNYESFLDELRNELTKMVANDEDIDRFTLSNSLLTKCITYKMHHLVWSNYANALQMGNTPLYSADEAKNALCKLINSLSQLFYATDILPVVEYSLPSQTEPPESTEPKVPTYSAGEYTTNGYSSKWLDLSYSTHWTMAASEYDIQINKNYTTSQLEQDPYAEAIEMQYYWAGTENNAVTIYVTKLKNTNSSVDSLADAQWDSERSFYIDLRSYGYSTNFKCDENQTITYLGQQYILQHLRFVSDNGRNEISDIEQWNLYRKLDGYLIRINFTTEYQGWTLDDFLCLFTSYDGSLTHKNSKSKTKPGTTDNGLFNVLDYSKVWYADYYFNGYFYRIYFVFQKNGTCYFALAADLQLWDAGKGNYTVNDYTLVMDITTGGNKLSGNYRFDPDSTAFVVTSQEGIVGNRGDFFKLYEDTTKDIETIIQWGNDYAYNSISWD